ncbi:MAG: AAA family ATPase, partial [Acidobacteriota bacterium]|nr:AAA family ATPase [Acidobacteriota bacterium]
MTDAPPDTDSEQSLLVSWIQRVLPAIRRAADSPEAPLHVYLFDRRGQRSLLDALSRHFSALCAIPAFYDLLTSTPALTQSIISFLGDEVRERQNLSPICQNLYEVARAMNFNWQDEALDATKSFRARVFDNVRPFERDAETRRFRVNRQGAGRGNMASVWVESAARFGTEIPLEYPYAAWGLLKETPDMGQAMRVQLRGFLGTQAEQIKQLASQRIRALRHIEESFRYKNRRVEKLALALGRLDQVEIEPEAIPLHRSLEDFLYLEHYAKRQELLLHLSLPPELRAETGRTAVMRCDVFEKRDNGEQNAVFTITDGNGNQLQETDTALLRFKEGDWAVLNPLSDEDGSPLLGKRLVHGRLCIVESIDEQQIRLRLHSMSFKKSEFRFGHRAFEPLAGAIYTLDEMADDFNADKFLEACRNASSNYLYQWLSNPDEGKQERRHIRPSRLRTGEKIAELTNKAQSPRGLTAAQRNVIGGYFKDRVLVLQGPPGTGKSHTLGFASLARALALSTPARPFRIAVAARTHAATEIALSSIKRRAEQLKAHSVDPLLAPLSKIKVMKIVNESGETLPAGVEPLLADGIGNIKATEQWAQLLEEPLLVIGGTPGGFYNLIKRGPSKGKSIDWAEKYFDLVIVDEASQMGIAEALMAATFLREDGQFIAIGDHRQMPPILAHAWDQESRRDLERARPHLSIFETLREAGYQSAALDESFRIPAEIAEFLNRHIYSEDGINFRSENRERLGRLNNLEGWLGAAMSPEHSLVVIEHSETGSEQS